MATFTNGDYNSGTALLEASPKVKLPPMYRVVIFNDDFTPMDFVVELLTTLFNMTFARARQVMLTVHQKGRGECGVFSRDIAETKVAQVTSYARSHEYPLLCVMEVV